MIDSPDPPDSPHPVEGNLFTLSAGSERSRETFETLLLRGNVRLERIVSTGQGSPDDPWYDQPQEEWVVLLSGAARLRFDDEPAARTLCPGDWLWIAPHRRHRVEWTHPEEPTVWLALHLMPQQAEEEEQGQKD